MIVKKPSIYIYSYKPDEKILREIFAGIEENGVTYELFKNGTSEDDSDKLAYDAAQDSMLGSGIGVCGQEVALQLKGLPAGQNVEASKAPTAEECRKIGANSARAIKKMPLL